MTAIHNTSKLIFSLLCFLAFSVTAFANQLHDKLSLNGMAAHSALKHEYYIGALYLPSPARSASIIFNADSLQRMELRVSRDSWTPRQFSQLWLQAININNSMAELKPMTKDVISFSNLISSKLLRGDNIKIDYTPGRGTEIRINDKLAFKTSNEGFYKALLKTWIGNRPPSGAFKAGILSAGRSNIDSTLLERFENLKPAGKRKIAIKKVQKERIKAATTAALKPSKKPDTKTKITVSNKAQAKQIQAKARTAANKTKTKADKKTKAKASGIETASKITTATSIQKQAAAKAATASAALAKAQKDKQKKPDTKPKKNKVKTTKDTPKKPKQTTAQIQQKGLLNAYKAYVQRRIYSKLMYPSKAYKRGLQGVVESQINIDRNGRIKDIKINSKANGMLQKAAKNAIKQAAPFEPLPKALNKDQVLLTVRINFKLPPR